MAIMSGTRGTDRITAGNANDVIFALAGRDTAWGGGGDDYVSGGAGVDLLYGDAGDDVLEGGEHDDILKAGDGDDLLRGGLGADQLDGGDDDDTVRGDEGNDRLSGGNGDDRLRGDSGNDRIDGGDGTDTAQFRGNADGYRITRNDDGTITVADIRLRDGWDGVDTLEGVERLRFADQVVELAPPSPQPFDLDIVAGNFGTNFTFVNQGGQQAGTEGSFLRGDGDLPGGELSTSSSRLGDLDGDGDLDLVLGNVNGAANQLLVNQGGDEAGTEGAFVAVELPGGSLSTQGLALGDVDGDGDLDIVLGNNGQANRILVNQGGAQLGEEGDLVLADDVLPGGDTGKSTMSLALGDLDGDGDLDILAGNASGNQILINQGGDDGSSEGSFALFDGEVPGSGGQRFGLALGDLDGDGDLDALVAKTADGNELLVNQGGDQGGTEGEFALDEHFDVSDRASRSVALGDIDGDGDLDALVGNYNNEGNQFLINQGGQQSGIEGRFVSVDAPGGPAGFTFQVALGDLDSDGDLDAIVHDTVRSKILINQGGDQNGTEGTFATTDAPDVGVALTFAYALGDIDGDGWGHLTPDGLPVVGKGVPISADPDWVA